MADAGKVADIEKELFDLRYEVYRLRKADKQASKANAENERGQGRVRKEAYSQKTLSSSRRGVGAVDSSQPYSASPSTLESKAIVEALEKDDLLRQISDLETELVNVKERRSAEQFTHGHVDEARKRERKSFQTLASHDAALIAKLEEKVASLERHKDGMKGIVDEVSKKAVLYVEQIEEKEKLLRENSATLDLLQRELERVKERNAELETGLEHKEPADPSDSSVDTLEDAVSRVPNDNDNDSIPSPNFLDVTGPVGSGFKGNHKRGGANNEETGLERLTTGESEEPGDSKYYRDPHPATPGTLHVSHLAPGDVSTSYAEDLHAIQAQIKSIADNNESDKVKALKAQLKQKNAVIAEQERSFEQLVSKAQETTLLEAEEIARLEGELIHVQEELRKNRRHCKVQEKAMMGLRKDKAILEDLLIDNEAAAVNQAMEALQSTAAKEWGSRRQMGRGKQPRPAMTPGALSAQDMIDVIRADSDPATGAAGGKTGKNNTGTGSVEDVPVWGVETSPSAEGMSPRGGDESTETGSMPAWAQSDISHRIKSSDSTDIAGLVSAAVQAEAEARIVALREKDDEIEIFRAREAELVDTLGGVLRKYHSLEKSIRSERDNVKRSKGMRF